MFFVLNTFIVAFVQLVHIHVFPFDTVISAILNIMIHDQLLHKKEEIYKLMFVLYDTTTTII